MLLVDGEVVGLERALGEDEPGTVSLEKFTNRRAPATIAASSVLNVLSMLLPKTTWGGLWIGCGIAAVCTTTSQPRASA